MKKRLLAIACLVAAPAFAQQPDAALQAKLKAQIEAAIALDADTRAPGTFVFSGKPGKARENGSHMLRLGSGKQLVAVACETPCDVDLFLADRNNEASGNDTSDAETPIIRVDTGRSVEAMLNVRMKSCEAPAGCSYAVGLFYAK
jgi:hypothetical protein